MDFAGDAGAQRVLTNWKPYLRDSVLPQLRLDSAAPVCATRVK